MTRTDYQEGDINLDNLDPKLKDLIEQYNAEIEPNSKHSSRVDSVARSSQVMCQTL